MLMYYWMQYRALKLKLFEFYFNLELMNEAKNISKGKLRSKFDRYIIYEVI